MANPEGRRQEDARATQVHCEFGGSTAALNADQLRLSGAFVPSLSPPAIDTEIELTLRSPVGEAVLRALVVQVITREQAVQSGRAAGFGVLFLDLADDQRAFIGLTLDALDRAARAQAQAQAAAAAARRRPSPPRPRIPSSPLEPPVATTRKRKLSAEGTATLQRLRSEFEKLPTRSPSAVLGLEPTADAETARNAFLEISKRCHPHVYARFDSTEINTAATDLFIAYKRAYSTVRANTRSAAKPAAGTAVAAGQRAAEPVASASASAIQMDPPVGFELATPLPPRPETALRNGGSPAAVQAGAGDSSPPPARSSRPTPAAARALAQLGQNLGGRIAVPSAQRCPAREPAVTPRSSFNPQYSAVVSERPRTPERRGPADTEMALRAALKHLAGSRFDQAELELERLCELCPDHRDSQVWLHVCRARKLKAERRPDAAIEHYRAVLALDPQHREANEHVARGRKRGGVVGKWFSGDDE